MTPDKVPEPRVRVTPFVMYRIWWRSRARHDGFRYWLLIQAPVVLLVFVALFGINVLAIDWRDAYDVTVQITSPWDTGQPWVAMPLSLAGWLVWPAVTGAVAGYVLTDVTGRRRARSVNELGSRYIPILGRISVPERTSRLFLQVLHSGRPKVAQSHWEKLVSRYLSDDVISSHATARQRIAQAVSKVVALTDTMPPGDKRCPFCEQAAIPEGGGQ